MVYGLQYRRPADTSAVSDSDLSTSEKDLSINRSIDDGCSAMSNGIPEALSFDRIINGGTCPPCNLRDFMNYLKYIEHDAENLQFFLWARSYVEKFQQLPESERGLSPEWTEEQAMADAANFHNGTRQMKVSADTAAVMKGTGLEPVPRVTEITEDKSSDDSDPFDQSTLRNPSTEVSSGYAGKSSTAAFMRQKAEGAFDEAGTKWQPFTIQPYRDEIARIITIYVAEGSPRQLNLSNRERNTLLHALANTTHPSALRGVLTNVEWSLRCQAHPNFIRWTICNGNRPRVFFARTLGITCIIGGVACGVLFTLSSLGRGWRVFSLFLFALGIATLIAAVKGMCIVLHGMHHRHLRPWEMFSDDEDNSVELRAEKSLTSLDSSDSTNSYEDEPWVAKYKGRNVVRKIFDRELWIQEPALRQIQDTIFLQSVLGGLLGGAILTAIFVAVPHGRLY